MYIKSMSLIMNGGTSVRRVGKIFKNATLKSLINEYWLKTKNTT